MAVNVVDFKPPEDTQKLTSIFCKGVPFEKPATTVCTNKPNVKTPANTNTGAESALQRKYEH